VMMSDTTARVAPGLGLVALAFVVVAVSLVVARRD